MTNIFISYSRRNKEFTQQLVNALLAANREVWADWQNIPAASDWDAEIKEGIRQAESVLFVLSSEWLKSNECRKELDYALLMGKRLITILHQPIEYNELPAELKKVNWIDMSDPTNFDRGFQTVCTALDTDLGWIKTHTRIQVRAVEWDKKNRDNSFTLRGKDLTDGEQFLAGAADKNPAPTPLQSEYILASRKDATRRSRITMAGISVALVVSIVLGVLAWFQRQAAVAAEATAVVERDRAVVAQNTAVAAEATAVANEQEAKRQAKIALARFLASEAQSVNSINSKQFIAALLDVQSMKLNPGNDAATFLINNNYAAYPISRVFHDSDVTVVDFSPDGRYVASGGEDNTVRVWEAATGQDVAQMSHDNIVTSLAFSPDSKYVVSGSNDVTARVWEIATGNEIARMTHDVGIMVSASDTGMVTDTIDGLVTSVAFSPDGKYVVSGGNDGTARVWEAATGIEIARMTHDLGELTGDNAVSSVAFSPDGRYVVSGGHDTYARAWETLTGREIAHMTHNDEVSSVAFSPDGHYVAVTAGGNWSIYLWDTRTWDEASVINQEFTITSIDFSPDGNYLAAGSADRTARVWEIATGNEVGRITHDDAVNTVAFSPRGNYVVSGSNDGTSRVWEAITGKEIARTNHDAAVSSVAFSPNGDYVVSGSWDHTVRVWKATTRSKIPFLMHDGAIRNVAFSPDGNFVASGGDDGTVRVWDLSSGQEVGRMSHDGGVTVIAYSLDGKFLVSGSWDYTARVWEVATGEEIASITQDSPLRTVSFSPDGKYVISGGQENTARIWEAVTGKEVTRITFDDNVWTSSFSPDGRYAVIGSDDSTARVLESTTWTEISRITHDLGRVDGRVISVAFSPDGKYVVSTSQDNTARVWETATGREISRMTHEIFPLLAKFSPNGEYVVSGGVDNIARVWEAATGQEISRTTYENAVVSTAFSPDGNYIVSGSADNTVRIWETTTGKEIARMVHGGQVNSVSFSPDGKYVVSGSDDGTARVWAWQPDDLVSYACEVLPRNLTLVEWNQYVGDGLPYEAICPNLPADGSVAAIVRETALFQPTTSDTPAATEASVIEGLPVEGVPATEDSSGSTISGAGSSASFVEEFDGNMDSWSTFMTSGIARQVKTSLDGGNLNIQLVISDGKLPWAYWINDSSTYSNVQVEAVVTNNGNNSNGVSLVCQHSDAGWYEFSVSSAGLYEIYAYDPNRLPEERYQQLIAGGSPAIQVGHSTNTYTAVCNGNELGLSINGTRVNTFTDTRYNYTEGKIGFGASSPNRIPIDVTFESLSVSVPE